MERAQERISEKKTDIKEFKEDFRKSLSKHPNRTSFLGRCKSAPEFLLPQANAHSGAFPSINKGGGGGGQSTDKSAVFQSVTYSRNTNQMGGNSGSFRGLKIPPYIGVAGDDKSIHSHHSGGLPESPRLTLDRLVAHESLHGSFVMGEKIENMQRKNRMDSTVTEVCFF